MSQRLHIIAACAQRKRLPVDSNLRLRSHGASATETRFQSFVAALEAAPGERLPARDLYIGSYWAAVRALPEIGSQRGLASSLWVASAGYGLIPADAPVCAYSATFQAGSPDGVASSEGDVPVREQLSSWWTELATWRGPTQSSPRRVRDLVTSDRKAAFVVIASPRYVQAMGSDLKQAATLVGDRLIVVSSVGAAAEPGIAEHLVPSEASLLPVVGGALPALHARVARDILITTGTRELRAPYLQARYRSIAERSSYAGMPQRDDASDAEIIAFIRRAVSNRPGLRHTPALRLWRGGGRACEQGRFKRLFREVTNTYGQ